MFLDESSQNSLVRILTHPSIVLYTHWEFSHQSSHMMSEMTRGVSAHHEGKNIFAWRHDHDDHMHRFMIDSSICHPSILDTL